MSTDNQVLQVQTKLGKVMILKKENPIPPGYHQLTANECYWIPDQLNQLLQNVDGQSIALQQGQIHSSYGRLRIDQQNKNSQLKYFAVLLPNEYFLNIQNFDQITQIMKTSDHIFLPIGLVAKVRLEKLAPEGFRKMLIQEGYQYKEELLQMLDTWSIVTFQTGKLQGSGYGSKIHDFYSTECGEMFVVSLAHIF